MDNTRRAAVMFLIAGILKVSTPKEKLEEKIKSEIKTNSECE